MTEVKTVCSSICVVSVVSGVILALMPESRLKNSFKAVTAIILIYTAVTFFSGFDYKNIDFKLGEKSDRQETEPYHEMFILSKSEQMLKQEASDLLSENGMNISLTAELELDGDTITKKIIIFDCISDKERNTVVRLLKKRYGQDIIIDFSG